jgi:hypothetical protein
VKKAAWNSNRPLKFPKANLKIYIYLIVTGLIGLGALRWVSVP